MKKGLVNLGLQYEPVTRVEELLQKIREIDEAILKLELLPKKITNYSCITTDIVA